MPYYAICHAMATVTVYIRRQMHSQFVNGYFFFFFFSSEIGQFAFAVPFGSEFLCSVVWWCCFLFYIFLLLSSFLLLPLLLVLLFHFSFNFILFRVAQSPWWVMDFTFYESFFSLYHHLSCCYRTKFKTIYIHPSIWLEIALSFHSFIVCNCTT